MLKEILKLKGAQKLTTNEQKSINGGDTGIPGGPVPHCGPYKAPCPDGYYSQCEPHGWVCVHF